MLLCDRVRTITVIDVNDWTILFCVKNNFINVDASYFIVHIGAMQKAKRRWHKLSQDDGTCKPDNNIDLQALFPAFFLGGICPPNNT